MLLTMDPRTPSPAGRRTGDGVVVDVDRTREIRNARRRTALVKFLRVACPVTAVALLGAYALSIAYTSGLATPDTLPEFAMRKILPEDLAMKNPRYEGFNKDGSSYVFTAKTAQQDLKLPNVITLNGIVGEVYQPDKTRTDITATRGIFNNEKSILDLYEEINVDSQTGLKARLTRATLLTKDDLLTSPEPVLVEFPNGSVRAKTMTLRQKAREATFSEDVVVELAPPADERQQNPAAAAPADAEPTTQLFTPTNGPIHIDAQRLDLNDGSKTALFTGNVQARQAGSYLTTPELEVSYEGEGLMPAAPAQAPTAASALPTGKLRRIVARKPVVMRRETGEVITSDGAEFDAAAQTAVLAGEVIMTSGTDRRAAGERVELDEAAGTVLLSGDVVVTQGLNELRGGRLAINRNDGTARLTTPPEAAFGPGRISARLTRGADAARAGGKKDAQPAAGGEDGGFGSLASFRADPEAPVEVAADALDVNDTRKVAVFRGDVDAAQGAFKIRCGELSAFYKGEAGLVDAGSPQASPKAGQKASTELTRIEARKNVRVTSKDGQTATGDWADFDTRTNKVTMGGNVVLSRGKSMVRGTRLLIDLTTGESKIDTAPQNTVSSPSGGGWVTQAPAQPEASGKGRASAVFFPQELQDEEEKSARAKKAPPGAPALDGWSATADPRQ